MLIDHVETAIAATTICVGPAAVEAMTSRIVRSPPRPPRTCAPVNAPIHRPSVLSRTRTTTGQGERSPSTSMRMATQAVMAGTMTRLRTRRVTSTADQLAIQPSGAAASGAAHRATVVDDRAAVAKVHRLFPAGPHVGQRAAHEGSLTVPSVGG